MGAWATGPLLKYLLMLLLVLSIFSFSSSRLRFAAGRRQHREPEVFSELHTSFASQRDLFFASAGTVVPSLAHPLLAAIVGVPFSIVIYDEIILV